MSTEKNELAVQAPLEPAPRSIGVYPDLVHDTHTTLAITEHFTWGDEKFSVVDELGTTLFICKKTPCAIHHTVVVCDPEERPLFTLSDKLLALTKTFIARDAEDESQPGMFQIQRHLSMDHKVELTFKNYFDQRISHLLVDADFWSGSADITYNNHVIATVRKTDLKLPSQYKTHEHQTFKVDIAPGVDITLIAAICISLDGMKTEARTGWVPDGLFGERLASLEGLVA